MPLLVVDHIPSKEDITGLEKPSEEEQPELVDADTLDMLPEKRRMATDLELKLPR